MCTSVCLHVFKVHDTYNAQRPKMGIGSPGNGFPDYELLRKTSVLPKKS